MLTRTSLFYETPHSKFTHKSMLLRGIKWPAPTLDHSDIEATKARASHSGRSRGGPFRASSRGRGVYNHPDARPNPFTSNMNQSPALSGMLGPSRRDNDPHSTGNWAFSPVDLQTFPRGPPPLGYHGQGPPGRQYGYIPPKQPPPPIYDYNYRHTR